MSDVIVVQKGDSGAWYWRTVDHGNNETLATSETYGDRSAALGTAYNYARDHRMALFVLENEGEDWTPFYSPPECVCLCGSTRFWHEFQLWSLHFTMRDVIVLSVGAATASDEDHGITEEQKLKLDDLHKRKIDMADAIFVINVDGYIGDSTRSELAYARSRGKDVLWLDYEAAVRDGHA